MNDATILRSMEIPLSLRPYRHVPELWKPLEIQTPSSNEHSSSRGSHMDKNQDFCSVVLAELSAITTRQSHDFVFLEVAPPGPSVVSRIMMR